MVRAPCCEKMGVKKGPWTPQEDQILISYIQNHGHGNWRALPKQAGLLRCGKSCRLRWINYLRPDIKRGNFTEEEETIIKLHREIGNRWSAIAARLPGRTDNEIKNVWHTHLKKKLKRLELSQTTRSHFSSYQNESNQINVSCKVDVATLFATTRENGNRPVSPQESSSEMSSVTYSSVENMNLKGRDIKQEEMDSSQYFSPNDESSFGPMQLVYKMSSASIDSKSNVECPSSANDSTMKSDKVCSSKCEDDMDFWFNLFIRPGNFADLL